MIHEKKLSDLAIFGGISAFHNKLHVGRPNIGDKKRIFERINDLLDRKWLTNNGPYVLEFEREIAEFIGARNCIATSSGTMALEIAIKALGLKGDVIIPSFTFIATAHALLWLGIKPVFCDINPKTYNIDIYRIKELINSQTTGIIGVHVWGRPCEIEALTEIAKQKNLKLLFDAAHSFGNSFNGKMIGSFGNAEVFSFHATKVINSFEGGCIVTNDNELASKIRLVRNFGFAGYDNVVCIGINGKMNEASAAMGITSLESLEEFITANHQNYKAYKQNLSDIPGISLMNYNENEKCNYQYIVIEIDESITNINRDTLVEILHAENVIARRYFFPACHKMEPYFSIYPNAGDRLPETEKIASRIICLPTGTDISTDEVRGICHILRFVIENGKEINKKLYDHPTYLNHFQTSNKF